MEHNIEQYITNGYLSITNPQLQPNAYFNYDSTITDFDFKNIVPTQYSNYLMVENQLNSVEIYFDSINIVKWNSTKGYGSKSRCKFIVKTSNPKLLWYKYESESPGSGNNLIYYKNEKIKLTHFVELEQNKLLQLFN